LKFKQKIIILITVVIASTLTISYLTHSPFTFIVNADTNSNGKFIPKYASLMPHIDEKRALGNNSQYKIAPGFEKTGENLSTININDGQPLAMSSLKGKVVLVNFWTYSCINVLRTVPHIIEWDAKYADKGLVIVGVHTPEFEFEKNIDNVKTSLQKYGIKYPVIQDNDYKIWNGYENNYWPRMYLVNPQGYIVYDKIGEGEYNQTEKVIRSLLAERNGNKEIENTNLNTTVAYENKSQFDSTNNISSFLKQPVDFSKIKTPELYFGNQGSNSAIGNSEGVHLGQTVTYTIPSLNGSIKPNTIYLEGKWKINPDNVELQSDSGRIGILYSAKAVNLVAGGKGQGIVHEDNALLSNYSKGVDTKNNSQFVIDFPRLYNIVNHQSYDEDFHSLIIDVKGKGFQAFAFTFG
jgi:thiol-disulfide isomerase/thioredoxin